MRWPIYRLFVRKGIDVSVIRRQWTFGEVLWANIALDIQDDADQQASERARAKAEANRNVS